MNTDLDDFYARQPTLLVQVLVGRSVYSPDDFSVMLTPARRTPPDTSAWRRRLEQEAARQLQQGEALIRNTADAP